MDKYVALVKDLRPDRANAAPVVVPVSRMVELLGHNKRRPLSVAEFRPAKVTDKHQPKYALVEGDQLVRHAVYAVGATADELMKEVRPLGSGRSGRAHAVPKRFSLGWEVQPLSSFLPLENISTEHSAVAKDNKVKEKAGMDFQGNLDQTRKRNKNKEHKEVTKMNGKDQKQMVRGVKHNDLLSIDDDNLACRAEANGNLKIQDENGVIKEIAKISNEDSGFQRKLRRRDGGNVKQAGNQRDIDVIDVIDLVEKQDDQGSSGGTLKVEPSEVEDSAARCQSPTPKRYFGTDIFGSSAIFGKDCSELHKQLDQALVQLEMLRQSNLMLEERNSELKELNSNLIAQNKQLTDTVTSVGNELKAQLDKYMSMQKVFHDQLQTGAQNRSSLASPKEVHQETSNRSISTPPDNTHQEMSKRSSPSSLEVQLKAKKAKLVTFQDDK